MKAKPRTRAVEQPKRELIAFTKNINPGTQDYLAERVKANGLIEEVRIRFYPGTERELRLQPFIEHKGDMREEIITYPSTTERHISGDDDYFVFPVTIPVEYDDFIKVFAENVNPDYIYTMSVQVLVRYF